jgi:uncharacterized protein (DUF427 family)
MPRARWSDTVLAQAERTLVVEGNHYFPPDTVLWEHLVETRRTSWCWWKGRARYLSIAVDDEVIPDAAWYYPHPWPLARHLKCHVAFGPAVTITSRPDRTHPPA